MQLKFVQTKVKAYVSLMYAQTEVAFRQVAADRGRVRIKVRVEVRVRARVGI